MNVRAAVARVDFRGSKAHRGPWGSSAVCGGLCETGAPRRHREGEMKGGCRGSGTQPRSAEAHLFSRSVSVTGV